MILTVLQAFESYSVGDQITDPATVTQILSSELAAFVVQGDGSMSNPEVGEITATGPTASTILFGTFNVSVWPVDPASPVAATFALERSFDRGTTWLPLTLVDQPLVLNNSFSTTFEEGEIGVFYRLNCLTFTGGAANFRLSHS